MSRDINKENKQTEIRQSFTHQKFLMGNSLKFSSVKHSRYMAYASPVIESQLFAIKRIFLDTFYLWYPCIIGSASIIHAHMSNICMNNIYMWHIDNQNY